MQGISSDLTQQLLQLNNQYAYPIQNPVQTQQVQQAQQTAVPVSGDINQTLLNDITSLSAGATDVGSLFDTTMNDLASFQDLISYTQNSLSQLKSYATDIKSLIAQAQQGGLTQNVLDKIQLDVNSKVLDINLIKDAANMGGINPFNGSVGINVPSFKSFSSGSTSDTEGSGDSYSIDLNFEVDGVQFAGSANVTIGTAEDGSMQLAFDVTLDYDLSSIMGEGGVTSEDAMNVIDGLLALMGDHEGTLENASSIMNAVLEKIFETMGSAQPNSDNINGYDSSAYLKDQIIQQADSTLDSLNLNQMPGVALGLI